MNFSKETYKKGGKKKKKKQKKKKKKEKPGDLRLSGENRSTAK